MNSVWGMALKERTAIFARMLLSSLKENIKICFFTAIGI
jgi:hypothetical protein